LFFAFYEHINICKVNFTTQVCSNSIYLQVDDKKYFQIAHNFHFRPILLSIFVDNPPPRARRLQCYSSHKSSTHFRIKSCRDEISKNEGTSKLRLLEPKSLTDSRWLGDFCQKKYFDDKNDRWSWKFPSHQKVGKRPHNVRPKWSIKSSKHFFSQKWPT